MNRNADQRSRRRLLLSSGRMIEVIHVGHLAGQHRAPLGCPRCQSDLVQPIAWHEISRKRYELRLNCPDCWWSGEVICKPDQIAEVEDRFEAGLATLLRDLKRLALARADEELEHFVAALQADLILPEDF